jgi:MFS family permease
MTFNSPQTPLGFRRQGLSRAWRRLLQLDEPAPLRPDGEVAAEVERNYRWNFTVNLLDGATFWFGNSFIAGATIVPLFISKLTDSPLPLGLAAMIAQGGWSLPQLFTAGRVEKLARKKPVVVNLGFFLERVPMWLIVVAAMLALRRPAVALLLFFWGFAWHSFGAGLVATSWQDLLARCFPVNRRGRLFGLTFFIGAGTGALGAGLSTWLLATYPFPTNFVILFSLAAAAITVSWFFLALTREPVQPPRNARPVGERLWLAVADIVRQDINFRRFLVARLLLASGSMGLGFVVVAAVQRWQLSDEVAGLYTATMLLGQTAGNLAFGLFADRFGHKVNLELCALVSAAAFAIAWLAPAPGWYYLVFALLGVAVAAVLVSGILVVMEFSPPDRRPTYTGLANTAVGVVTMVAPLLGAALALAGYDWLFLLSALFNLLAFAVMRWWVREPRFSE